MDIHYANYLATELYGIEISEDKFEELALIAYNMIGNHTCKLYRYIASVDPKTLTIELPCNLKFLVSITTSFEDWEHVTNKQEHGDITSAVTEDFIEKGKTFMDPLYQSGKYLKYELVGNTLYFDRPYSYVSILYKGEYLDDNGLPVVTEKEATAIAAYIAYTQKYKDGLITMNPNIIQVAQTLKQEWNIKCDQARTPEAITQNEFDEILDAKTNWNRKQFRKTYKPIL